MKTTSRLLVFFILSSAATGFATHKPHQGKRDLYCLSTEHPATTYKKLKEIEGEVHLGILFNHDSITSEETCESLIEQCTKNFGENYIFIQSAEGPTWGVVREKEGVICSHLFEIDDSEL